MSQFIKHIGKHGDRTVAIVYRTIPDEEHMALVIYPANLSSIFHDSVMRVINSNEGQAAKELADVLFRSLLPDGRAILPVLHHEGMIKKVPTSQILITPSATSNVRLDELNKIFESMEKGEAAVKQMQDIDNNLGLVDPTTKRLVKENMAPPVMPPMDIVDEFPLMDSAINKIALNNEQMASDLKSQAAKLSAEAKSMVQESKRLRAEAKALLPPKKVAVKKKKTVAKKKKAAVNKKALS